MLCYYSIIIFYLQKMGGFLGGVRKDAYKNLPKQIQSKHGYEGCLGSLDLNGESPNILVEALIPSNLVIKGCEGERTNERFISFILQKWREKKKTF